MPELQCDLQVFIGESEFSVDSVSINTSNRQTQKSFSIQISQGNITFSPGATVTIKGFLEGASYTLVKEGKVHSISRQITKGKISWTISGDEKADTIATAAPVKDLYYLRKDWLDELFGKKWLGPKADGKIYLPGSGFFGDPDYQVYIPGLPRPGKEQYLCIVGSGEYSWIARDLAQRAGYDVECNVPELRIKKFKKIPSTRTYLASIQSLFSIWNPAIFVENGKISIVDVQTKKPDPSFALDATTLAIIDWTKRDTNKIDRARILGKLDNG